MSFPSLSQADVLYISLALNGLLLLRGLVCRLLDLLYYLLRGHCRLLSWVGEISRVRPGLVGRVLFEQLSLWFQLSVTTLCLRHTPIASQPFSYQPSLPALLQASVALTTAHALLQAARVTAGRDVHVLLDHAKLRPTHGLTGHPRADVVYALADAGAKLVCWAYKENLFLTLSTPFFDIALGTLELQRLMGLLRHHGVGEGAVRRAARLHLFMFVLCRVLLPVVFLSLAVLEESPTVMDPVPLGSFFVAGVTHTGFHLFGLYQSIQLARRCPVPAPPLPRPCKVGQSAGSPLEVLTNDIFGNSRSPLAESPKGFPLFKGFDYIFVRRYDNRNVSCVRDKDSSEKVNILKRKNVSKNALLYKIKRSDEKCFQEKAEELEHDLETSSETEFTTMDSLLLTDPSVDGQSTLVTDPSAACYSTLLTGPAIDGHNTSADRLLKSDNTLLSHPSSDNSQSPITDPRLDDQIHQLSEPSVVDHNTVLTDQTRRNQSIYLTDPSVVTPNTFLTEPSVNDHSTGPCSLRTDPSVDSPNAFSTEPSVGGHSSSACILLTDQPMESQSIDVTTANLDRPSPTLDDNVVLTIEISKDSLS